MRIGLIAGSGQFPLISSKTARAKGFSVFAAAYRKEGRGINTQPPIWCATASLNVKYLRPTPIDEAVVLRARIKEATAKKTIVTCSLFARGEECAVGEVVAVRVPERFWDER